MTKKTYTRRTALKTGAAAGALITAPMIITPKKSWAQRAEKLVYWHLASLHPARR